MSYSVPDFQNQTDSLIVPDFPCPHLKVESPNSKFNPNSYFTFQSLLNQKPSFRQDVSKLNFEHSPAVPKNVYPLPAYHRVGKVDERLIFEKPEVTPYEFERVIPEKKISFQDRDKSNVISDIHEFCRNEAARLDIYHIRIEGFRVEDTDVESLHIGETTIFDYLALYPNLEYLQLKDCGIDYIPNFNSDTINFKNLIFMDISNNDISNPKYLHRFLKLCPRLQSLDIRGNRNINKISTTSYILSKYPNINTLNGEPVTYQTWRTNIPDYFRTKEYEIRYFQHVVISIPELRYGTSLFGRQFDPSLITHLSLPNMMIRVVILNPFVNLVSLNLSDNNIQKLRGSGAELLQNLISVNLDGNQISSTKELSPFMYTLRLRHIFVSRNLITNYRMSLIYKFRNLLGTEAMNGIQSIDGLPVTIEEYLQSIGENNSSVITQSLMKEKWVKNVERIIGNTAFFSAESYQNAISQVRTLNMANRGLHRVDLVSFSNIYILCLRNNFLTYVHRLQQCKSIQYLDLSQNNYLDIYSTLKQVRKLPQLRHLLLARDCWTANFDVDSESYQVPKTFWKEDAGAGSVFNRNYRMSVLRAILKDLQYLTALDLLPVTFQERTNVLLDKYSKRIYSKDQINSFKAGLAIYLAGGKEVDVPLTIDKIKDVIDRSAPQIQSLIRLQGVGIPSAPNFNFPGNKYSQLKHLNLSYNRIVTMKNLQIENHPTLMFLDISNNLIVDSLSDIANILNTLRNLVGFAIHHNPTMSDVQLNEKDSKYVTKILTTQNKSGANAKILKSKNIKSNQHSEFHSYNESRLRLLSMIKGVATQEHRLKILDYTISSLDIYKAFPNSFKKTSHEPISPVQFQMIAIKYRVQIPYEKWNTLTTLDLSKCALKHINLSFLPQLQNLNLRGNKLQNGSIAPWIGAMVHLESLDLRENHFDDTSDYIAIAKLPQIRNIGIDSEVIKDIRSRFIRDICALCRSPEHLLNWALHPLKSINDAFMQPSEVNNVWTLMGNPPIDSTVKWLMAYSRYIPRPDSNGHYPTIRSLDLSHAELTVDEYVTLNLDSLLPMIDDDLHYLSLSNNNLTDSNLKRIQSTKFVNVKVLDVSYNQISSTDNFSAFLSSFSSLDHLIFHGNPICEKPSDYVDYLHTFNRISDAEFRLSKINNIDIKPEDRVNIVKQNNPHVAESFRTKFYLANISENWRDLTTIDLSDLDITDIMPLKEAKNLTTLDLSNNCITELPLTVFKELTNLRSLNISNNKLPNIAHIVESISYCPNLEQLYMWGSTKDKDLTHGSHLDIVCRKLRGLQYLDMRPNVHILTPPQWTALSEIKAMCGWYLPNHTLDIDLSIDTQDHTDTDIANLIRSLSVLSPLSLQTPLCVQSQKNGAYKFISALPSLIQCDGKELSQEVRMNAHKAVLAQNNGTISNFADNAQNVGIGIGVGEMVMDAAQDDIQSDAESYLTYAIMIGTVLSKWEIVITFQQILTQIIIFIDRIKWPKIYLDLSWLTWIFTLDLSFLNFFLNMRLPMFFSYISLFAYTVGPPLLLLFFYHEYNKEKFIKHLITQSNRTFKMSLWALFVMVLCSFGLGALFDFNQVYFYKRMTDNMLAWGISLSGFSLLIIILFWVLMYYFNKHSDEKLFWDNFILMKRRAALFGITVLYAPGCKFFIELVQCNDTFTSSKGFAEVLCLNSISNLTLVHCCAIFFGITYALFIPGFFIKLINEGVGAIDYYCGIDSLRKTLEEHEEELDRIKDGQVDINDGSLTLIESDQKKMSQEEIIKLAEGNFEKEKEDLEKKYALEANNYDHPASYLYNQYSRSDRYTKVIGLIKKLLMMLFTAFFPRGWLQSIAATSLIFGTSLYQTIIFPFIAWSENILETAAQIGNSVTLLIGQTLQFDMVQSNGYKSVIAPILLIAVIGILLFMFLYYIFVYHLCFDPHKKDSNQDDYEYEYEYEEETLEAFVDNKAILADSNGRFHTLLPHGSVPPPVSEFHADPDPSAFNHEEDIFGIEATVINPNPFDSQNYLPSSAIIDSPDFPIVEPNINSDTQSQSSYSEDEDITNIHF